MGTHHGAVQPSQLDFYLNEFVFRFNRRTSASRGLLFYRLLQQAVVTGTVTYDSVVGTVAALDSVPSSQPQAANKVATNGKVLIDMGTPEKWPSGSAFQFVTG